MLVFANPAFLWALAAASVPLMLHMFQRRKTVVTPFPTLRFLKMAQKRSSSRVRFENFLLWLLRTLLLLTLALAFALPVLRSLSGDSWLSRTRRDVAIVIDASYSMNYTLERGKVFDTCKDAAVNVVNSLFPGDRVCVYVAADLPIPVIEKPTTEHATVIQAINALNVLPVSSKLDETVALALRALERQEGKREREIYILTDGQALAWHGFRDTPKDGEEGATGENQLRLTREQRDNISFFTLLAGATLPDNTTPMDVKMSPLLMLVGQTARLNVRIGHSGPAKQVTVAVEVAGQERARRSIDIEADAETTTDFAISGLEPGVHVATITTPQDALADDDAFQFLIRVRKQLPALIAGPPEATRYLKAALAPGAADESVKQVTAAELAQIDLRDYQAIFLCDAFPLDGQAIMRVEEYTRNGGVLVVFPGDHADPHSYQEMKILPAFPTGLEGIATEQAARPLRRLPHQEGQVVTFHLPLPPGTVPIVALKRVLTLGEPQEGGATLISAGDNTTFMTGRAVGRGRVFMFTVGADRDWSTFPLTAFFVPVIHQLIRQGAGAAVQPPHLALGVTMPANEAIFNYREDDEINTPSGANLAIKDNGNRTLFIEDLPEPGIYTRLKTGSVEPEPVLAVNSDRHESLLTPATLDELREWTGFKKFFTAHDPEELNRLIEEYRNGRSLAELFLWLALLLALIEWWLACRAMRSQSGATEKMTVDLAGKISSLPV